MVRPRPTHAQRETFDALLRIFATVRITPCEPAAANLYRAVCLDAAGDTAQTVYVYRDGLTSAQTRRIAA